jgi:Ca2+-binding EF-hand superfamily protein
VIAVKTEKRQTPMRLDDEEELIRFFKEHI